jgi:uncharacterized protein YdeI (YjbR/CyaY-like superfamily)
MITAIEDFFTKGCGRCDRFDTPACSALRWSDCVAALRQICVDMGLVETLKWGHPCYMHAGRNVVIIGALREEVRLNFFDAALLTDPEGLLRAQGENTQHPDSLRFTSAQQIHGMDAAIRGFIHQSMANAAAGRRPPKRETVLELPDELAEALEADAAMGAAFAALTPGRQRSYAILIGGLKKPESRVARISKMRDHILAGKGALER